MRVGREEWYETTHRYNADLTSTKKNHAFFLQCTPVHLCQLFVTLAFLIKDYPHHHLLVICIRFHSLCVIVKSTKEYKLFFKNKRNLSSEESNIITQLFKKKCAVSLNWMANLHTSPLLSIKLASTMKFACQITCQKGLVYLCHCTTKLLHWRTAYHHSLVLYIRKRK